MPAGLGRPQADREVKPLISDGGWDHATIEGHAIVPRGKLHHTVIVALVNAIAVAKPQRRVEHGRLPDLGGDVSHLYHIGRVIRGRPTTAKRRQPGQKQGDRRESNRARQQLVGPFSHSKSRTAIRRLVRSAASARGRARDRPTRPRNRPLLQPAGPQAVRGHLDTANTQTTPPCGTSFSHPTNSLISPCW